MLDYARGGGSSGEVGGVCGALTDGGTTEEEEDTPSGKLTSPAGKVVAELHGIVGEQPFGIGMSHGISLEQCESSEEEGGAASWPCVAEDSVETTECIICVCPVAVMAKPPPATIRLRRTRPARSTEGRRR